MDKMLEVAEVVDALRVMPRIIIMGYFWLCAELTFWIMGQTEISNQEMALVVTITGLFVPMVKFYQDSGRKWRDS